MALKKFGIALCLIAVAVYGPGAHARREPRLLWTRLKNAALISEGTGQRRLYVFFDPDCPYCHRLYEDLQPLIGPKGLKVGWVPVGILKISSFGKAAHLLEAKSPWQALARAENGYRGERGLAVTPRRATVKIAADLMRNAHLLRSAGGNGVPFLVYKDQEGLVRATVGDPPGGALLRIIQHIGTKVRTR